MASLSRDVAKLEEEHRALLFLATDLARHRFGSGLKMYRDAHRHDVFTIGDSTGEHVSDIGLSQDLANDIVCLASGITVSGRR